MKNKRKYNKILKRGLEEQGYNFRERMNVYAGITMGFLAPIVAVKYFIFPKTESILGEAFAWASSIAINCSPALFHRLPVPIYTTVAGLGVGKICASRLHGKRVEKENQLENITNAEVQSC